MQPRQPRKISGFFGVAISLVFVGASLGLFLNRQYILDRVTVMRNQPSASIVAAADRAGFNDHGKFLLYASIPEIQERDTFRNSCSNRGEKTAVLGCYSSQRIYILDVTDERLDGIEEVTLAHEMLHAAYERLSSGERRNVDTLLDRQYGQNNDARLKELMDVYAKTEPGERNNELHSILATERGALIPELEAYYERYFSDRQKVASLFEQYHGVFEEIKDQQQSLVDELNVLAESINQQILRYNADAEALSSDIETFNRSADTYSSQTAFDRDRRALVARQSALRQVRDAIAVDIATYDAKKAELDALNLQASELNQSINTNIDETPSL